MSILSIFRVRRFIRAVERIAAAQEELVRIARESQPVKRKPRATEFGSFDVADANKRWREEREVLMIDEDREL
jgi:hypothetical protein